MVFIFFAADVFVFDPDGESAEERPTSEDISDVITERTRVFLNPNVSEYKNATQT
jgi:hypothetical protein